MSPENPSDTDQEEKIIQILSNVLGVSSSTIRQEANRELYSEWDSMKHVELVIAIETEFGFRLKGEEVGKMNSLEQILFLVQTKLSNTP